jgi:GrpB-like predicted nucleotidyltransferase (UPF0157 family)
MVLMHPADPDDVGRNDNLLAEVTVGRSSRLSGRIGLCDHDGAWRDLYEREAGRVSAVLGQRVVRREHVGSTSVAGLPANPIIDMVL